jgi:hypothetical protein
MKWLVVLCFCIVSCGQNNEPAAVNSDTITKKNNADTIIKSQQQSVSDKLIVPGESIGKTSIGADAASLENILGKPDASDAAMGKAWLTWNGKRDEHNNATTLNVYTTYKDSSMSKKTVQQVRTTSSYFSTSNGIHVYASFAAINNQFPDIKKLAHYNDDGRDIVIYDDKQNGIAFEIASANEQQICTGIIVHKKGEAVTNVYMFLHPDMKLYE